MRTSDFVSELFVPDPAIRKAGQGIGGCQTPHPRDESPDHAASGDGRSGIDEPDRARRATLSETTSTDRNEADAMARCHAAAGREKKENVYNATHT
jgi:hypothetical protein